MHLAVLPHIGLLFSEPPGWARDALYSVFRQFHSLRRSQHRLASPAHHYPSYESL